MTTTTAEAVLPYEQAIGAFDPALGLVPEISGHRLIVSIRLMRPDGDGRLKPAGEDHPFELALCT